MEEHSGFVIFNLLLVSIRRTLTAQNHACSLCVDLVKAANSDDRALCEVNLSFSLKKTETAFPLKRRGEEEGWGLPDRHIHPRIFGGRSGVET